MLSASVSAFAADWTPVAMSPNPEDVQTEASSLATVRIDYGTDWEFTVAEGAKLTLVNEAANVSLTSTKVELWEFALSMMGEYYLSAEFPTPTANGAYVLTIPAGTMIHNGEGNPEIKYTITLNDASLDGTTVPELQLLSADPAAGTELPTVGLGTDEGRVYTFNTNINEYVAYLEASWYDVTDPENPEWIAMTDANHEVGSDSPLVIVCNSDYEKMYAGHTYSMEVTCYNSYAMPRKELGKFTVEYKGTTPEYVYATQKAVAVDPDPATYSFTSPEDAHFTVSFDGPVQINENTSKISLGSGMNSGYGSVTSNEAKTEWTFTIPESLLDEVSFICFVQATDSEGRTVIGNETMSQYQSGVEEGAGFMFVYYNDMTGADLKVTPAEGSVTSLKSFEVTPVGTYEDMVPSWYGVYPYVIKGRDIVYTFNLENDMDNSTPGKAILTMPEEQTEPGTYMLVIPKGVFTCTSGQGEGEANKEFTALYVIEGEEEETVYDFNYTNVNPAAGKVTEIKNVTFTFAEDVSIMLYDAYILDADGNQVRKADVQGDFDDWKIAFIEFEPLTEAGTYTLYIPKGTFGDEAYGMSEGGHASDDIRIEYTIDAASVDAIGAESLSGDVYNVAGVLVLRNADAEAIKTLDKGIYIVGGKKIAVK